MSDVKHEPGTFCWVELMTADAAASKAFYTELLGWETSENPIPGGGSYTMISVSDGSVGGMFQMDEEMKKKGVPPHWQVYVSVADADASVAKAKSQGATVMQEPFDVMTYGRMATLQDPAGATFSVWQPKDHQGYGHAEPCAGAVCWHELTTSNVDAAGKFYASLFGWKPDAQDMGGSTYVVFKSGDKMRGGMMAGQPGQGGHSQWGIHFLVPSCADAVAKTQKLGGKVLMPTTEIPNMGRFANLQDKTGVAFSVFEPNSK